MSNAVGSEAPEVMRHEPMILGVVNALKARGYETREPGIGVTQPADYSHQGVVILKPTPPVTTRHLFGLIKTTHQPRRPQPGRLLINKKKFNARPDHWVLHVYGRENLQEMESLVKEIADSMGVPKVKSFLDCEERCFETTVEDMWEHYQIGD